MSILLYAQLIIGGFPSIIGVEAYHSVVRKLSISLTTKGERNFGLRGEIESGGSDSRADLKTNKSKKSYETQLLN